MKKLLLTSIAALALYGCAGAGSTQSSTDAISNVIVGLSNKAIKDLQGVVTVSNAATPQDTDGAMCAGTLPNPAVAGDTGTGGLAVAAAIQKVAQSTVGTTPGAFTKAEILSLYQPGSAQWNWAVKTLESACINKVHDINQAAAATEAGIMNTIAGFLALSAS